MNEEKMLKGLKAISITSLMLVWYYAVSILVSLMAYAGVGDINRYQAYIKGNQNLLMVIIYLMLFFGLWAFDQKKESFISIFTQCPWKKLFIYVVVGIGAYWVSNLITSLLMPLFPDYKDMVNQISDQQIVLGFIGTALLPPIVEEYLFRHKIQVCLKEGFGARVAIIAQAIIFGLLHTYTIQKIYAFLLGAFFGWVTEREGTARYSLIMHITINTIGWVIGMMLIGKI